MQSYEFSFNIWQLRISEVSADEPVATEWYDLSGRRVANPAKGFYINNRGEKIRL